MSSEGDLDEAKLVLGSYPARCPEGLSLFLIRRDDQMKSHCSQSRQTPLSFVDQRGSDATTAMRRRGDCKPIQRASPSVPTDVTLADNFAIVDSEHQRIRITSDQCSEARHVVGARRLSRRTAPKKREQVAEVGNRTRTKIHHVGEPQHRPQQ